MPVNPYYMIRIRKKGIKTEHISAEHLANPSLDDFIEKQLQQYNIEIRNFSIDKSEYKLFVKQANYPVSYYGGGLKSKLNFTEKTLEHYVSCCFIDFKPEMIFIDYAAANSPFQEIVKHLFGVKQALKQDIIFPKGLKGDKLGGYPKDFGFPNESIDAVTLHCSLEHFEGESDIEFFLAMEKLLKPGGKIVVLPFYLSYEYTIHIDPIYNLLKLHTPKIDEKAQLRYCDWRQFFSRHYSPDVLYTRILSKLENLKLTIYKVNNFKEIDEMAYLRYVAVFTKVQVN